MRACVLWQETLLGCVLAYDKKVPSVCPLSGLGILAWLKFALAQAFPQLLGTAQAGRNFHVAEIGIAVPRAAWPFVVVA